jgi:hypothetical protein
MDRGDETWSRCVPELPPRLPPDVLAAIDWTFAARMSNRRTRGSWNEQPQPALRVS